MRPHFSGILDELRPMASLAWPVILGELGWMGMGVADTVMVGRVGAEAIGAVSVGRAIFLTLGVFGIGLLLGLDTLVSQAHGANDRLGRQRALVHALVLAGVVAVPMTLVVYGLAPWLGAFGIDRAVADASTPYVRAIAFSSFPLLAYSTFRRYLQGLSRVRPVMLALVSANVVNVAGNWVLIYGNLGFPALGAEGAGWSTCLSSAYMAVFLFLATLIHDREEQGDLLRVPRLGLDAVLFRRLLALGWPVAIQLLLEVSVFALGTALIARLDPVSLAAHHIALTAASITYMVPLGISSAAAVRVGQAIGRGDPRRAGQAGWAALALGSAFMACAAMVFVFAPRPLVRLFAPDPEVVAVGVGLLLVAALFQLCDGLQIVATGALRGLGDTRTPMIWNLVAHWLLGLPIGYLLCFVADRGVVGFWIGWLVGLTVVGVALPAVWARASEAAAAT